MSNLKDAVVSKYLKKAGAAEFSHFVKGTDPGKLFRELVDHARHESGHGGYSGTIAEKPGFKIRSRTPMSMAAARNFVDKDIDKNDKWDDAFAVPISESKDLGSQDIEIVVEASSEQEATQLAQSPDTALKGKAKPGVDYSIRLMGPAVKVSEAGLPEYAEADRPEGLPENWFRVRMMSNRQVSVTHQQPLTSKPGAKAEMKRAMANGHVGDVFWVEKVATLAPSYKITALAQKKAKWKVSLKVTAVKPGTLIVGWMFYGWASS